MGKLYPIGLQEVLPGDVFRHSTSAMVRLSPMAAPVMHSMTIRIHHWFVPHRIVWDGFEDFITGGPDGMNADTIPTYEMVNAQPDNIGNFWGIPTGRHYVNALPTRGYNLIYNEYYRDQDLTPELAETNDWLATVAWEKDYFTTARPWEQKGPQVTIPLGGVAPVYGMGMDNFDSNTGELVDPNQLLGPWPAGDGRALYAIAGQSGEAPTPRVYTDLSDATAISISDLRRAFALQRFEEARAQYGSRYSEYLRYYGVRPSDARLDRPEYLGGAKTRVNVSEVLQTAPETGEQPTNEYGVGDLYGHGIGGISAPAYRRRFPEHGYVHSFISIRPKAVYQDMVDRHFLKRDKFDIFAKEMQYIGQQEVWQGELGDLTDPYTVFGYQDRYREYCESRSRVTGEFKDLLDYWHLARQFESNPALNSDFVKCNPSKRIFNVETNDVLWMMAQHKISALRQVVKTPIGKIY